MGFWVCYKIDRQFVILWNAEERTQLANKTKGLSRLKAKLLVIAEEQRAKEIKQIRGDAVKAEWGQQIRNYIFHPYKLVKDVRTGLETSDVVSVLDGELDPFVKAYLKYKYSMAMATAVGIKWPINPFLILLPRNCICAFLPIRMEENLHVFCCISVISPFGDPSS